MLLRHFAVQLWHDLQRPELVAAKPVPCEFYVRLLGGCNIAGVDVREQWSNQQGLSFSIDYDDFRDVFFGY